MQISPLSLTGHTRLVERIPSKVIIDLYRNELEVDVSRIFNNVEEVSIFECLDTGYLFYFPYSVVGDEKLYDDLKLKMPELYHVPYYPLWKWEYDIVLKYILKSESVIEIGCGSGVLLKKLKDINEDRKLKGLELNRFSVNEARKKGIDAQVETIQDFSKTNDFQFDVVCFFQVLEHVYDTHSFLEASVSCLKSGGKLIIAVPYNDPFLFKNDMLNTLNLPPHHMGLWNQKAFNNLPQIFPLKLRDIVVENIPGSGYDFERFYTVNKDIVYKPSYPLKKLFDKIYYRYLRLSHKKHKGKNIIAVYTKL